MSRPSYRPTRSAFPNELKALFEQLAAWAVASTFGAAALGCSADKPVGAHAEALGATPPPPPPPVAAPWQPQPACEQGVLQLATVHLDKPVDYLAAVRSGRMLDRAANFRHAPATHGTPCATAKDKPACEAEVARRMEPPEGSDYAPMLLVTEGDAVRSIASAAEYRELSGAIDTSDEAMLAAFLAGQPLKCKDDGRHEGTKLRASGTGYEIYTHWEDCSRGVFEQTTLVAADGTTKVSEAKKLDESHCVIGRRPEGLCFAAPFAAQSALGRYFACSARLEAASVFAFERLGRELRALGAPNELVQRCAKSALEEIEHTRITSALAERFGAVPALPSLATLPVRGALAIAVENAIEGCVRETFGALLAYHQAATARDPDVRQAMIAIAGDEARHAELAWAISRWLEPQLSLGEQARVALERTAAVQTLEADEGLELGERERAAIGWPSRTTQAELLARLRLAVA